MLFYQTFIFFLFIKLNQQSTWSPKTILMWNENNYGLRGAKYEKVLGFRSRLVFLNLGYIVVSPGEL